MHLRQALGGGCEANALLHLPLVNLQAGPQFRLGLVLGGGCEARVLLHLPFTPTGKPRVLPRVGPARTCARRSVAAVRRARSTVCSSSAAAQNASGSYTRIGSCGRGKCSALEAA